MKLRFTHLSIALLLNFLSMPLFGQLYPLSLQTRIDNSPTVLIGEVIGQRGFWDAAHTNIYTESTIAVKSYLKGKSELATIKVNTLGGIVGNQAVQVCPSEDLGINQQYLFFLENENKRTKSNGTFQLYGSTQGRIPYQAGQYKDILSESPMNESQLLQRLEKDFQLQAFQPNGERYLAATTEKVIQKRKLATITSLQDGSGATPSQFVGGTITNNNNLVINGTGFGATQGSIRFSNVDDGGTSNVLPLNSDYISWTDTRIEVKISGKAGTGTLRVLDNTNTEIATSPITIKWGELNLNSIFSGFTISTRQQVHLSDINEVGGYEFQFSSHNGGAVFSTDSDAQESFRRALITWRCGTLVNYDISTTPTTVAAASDDISAVLYDNTLSAGILGQCVSRFLGYSSGNCNLYNTVWFISEMDIRMPPIPATGFTWNKTTAAANFSQYDMESVLLHEIGHGHGMEHINTLGNVMYHAIANGSTIRTASAENIECGNYRINQSTGANCDGFVDPHIPITLAECNDVVLPIELLNFSATAQNNRNVVLQWEIAPTPLPYHFVIQRSNEKNGIFEDISPLQKGFFFIDKNVQENTVYYRLKMIDENQKVTFSEVRSVILPENKGKTWSVYPNPFQNTVYINGIEKEAKVQIYDTNGKIVLQQNISNEINVSNLTSGIYLLKISRPNGEVLHFQKIIK